MAENTSTLLVSFANDTSASNRLSLEQEAWPDNVGKTSVIDIIRGIGVLVLGDELDAAGFPCGYAADRSFTTRVFAYTTPDMLQYRIGSTLGAISGGSIEQHPMTEVIDFRLDSAGSLSHPIMENSGVTTRWLSAPLDEMGDETTEPAVVVDGSGVAIDKPVYGSLLVSYVTLRHVHLLVVQPRGDVEENAYQSTVWAAYDGGVELLSISPPPGAEEDLAKNIDCTNRGGWNMSIDSGDYHPPVVPSGEMITKEVDYCTVGDKHDD